MVIMYVRMESDNAFQVYIEWVSCNTICNMYVRLKSDNAFQVCLEWVPCI
jgi:hypothetical protein